MSEMIVVFFLLLFFCMRGNLQCEIHFFFKFVFIIFIIFIFWTLEILWTLKAVTVVPIIYYFSLSAFLLSFLLLNRAHFIYLIFISDTWRSWILCFFSVCFMGFYQMALLHTWYHIIPNPLAQGRKRHIKVKPSGSNAFFLFCAKLVDIFRPPLSA